MLTYFIAMTMAAIPPEPPPVVPWDEPRAEAVFKGLQERGSRLGLDEARRRADLRRAMEAMGAQPDRAARLAVDSAWDEYNEAFGEHWKMRVDLEAAPMTLGPLSPRDADRIAEAVLARRDILAASREQHDALREAALANRRVLRGLAAN